MAMYVPKHCTQLKISGISLRLRAGGATPIDELPDDWEADWRWASRLSRRRSAMSMYSPRNIRATSFCGTGGKPSLSIKGFPTPPLVASCLGSVVTRSPLSVVAIVVSPTSPASPPLLLSPPSPSVTLRPSRSSSLTSGISPRPAPVWRHGP